MGVTELVIELSLKIKSLEDDLDLLKWQVERLKKENEELKEKK